MCHDQRIPLIVVQVKGYLCTSTHCFNSYGKLSIRSEPHDVKCDEDENYMPRDEDDTEKQEVAQPQVDEILEEENEIIMNTVGDNIANALVS
jgi:hypothetical protein